MASERGRVLKGGWRKVHRLLESIEDTFGKGKNRDRNERKGGEREGGRKRREEEGCVAFGVENEQREGCHEIERVK